MYDNKDFLPVYTVCDTHYNKTTVIGNSIQELVDFVAKGLQVKMVWNEEKQDYDEIPVNRYKIDLILQYDNPHNKRWAFYRDDVLINPFDYCSDEYLAVRGEYLIREEERIRRKAWREGDIGYYRLFWKRRRFFHSFRFRIDPVPRTGKRVYKYCRQINNQKSVLREKAAGYIRKKYYEDFPFVWDDRMRSYDRSWKSSCKCRHQWQKHKRKEDKGNAF